MFIVCTIAMSSAQETAFPVLKGAYFGQKPPGMTPEIFAPEVYSRYPHPFCSIFAPAGDEFYFVTDIDDDDQSDIMWMRMLNDTWTEPSPAPFNSDYGDNDLCISPDGYRVFFRSWRPLPGHDKPEERSYIWFARREKGGWSEPQPVEFGGVPLLAGYPSVASNGTIYFGHRSPHNVGEGDLHRATFRLGSYGPPENLGRTINTVYSEGDMYVASDERYLIVSCWDRPDNNGESDLYISFRTEAGTWSSLLNMGSTINSEANENCPTISPDGKYFLFFRYYTETSAAVTYWIDAKIIESLRPGAILKGEGL
jgi:hypothetical protein